MLSISSYMSFVASVITLGKEKEAKTGHNRHADAGHAADVAER